MFKEGDEIVCIKQCRNVEGFEPILVGHFFILDTQEHVNMLEDQVALFKGSGFHDEDCFELIYKITKASEKQVDGNHYSKLKIQPMKYALENNLNYAQANAIKYITRYKDKNGIEDLKKAIHCIELLIEHEEQD
jgi:hypothetical protein